MDRNTKIAIVTLLIILEPCLLPLAILLGKWTVEAGIEVWERWKGRNGSSKSGK